MGVLQGRQRLLAALATLATLVASISLAAAPSAGANTELSSLPILEPRTQAPTALGAPFLPAERRNELVLARLDARTQLDELAIATEALELRLALADPSEGTAGTARILESRVATLEREVAVTESAFIPLLEETEQFDIAHAAFPVAALRKPFFNDWGRPRSGGRTHKGNDMLAQTGIDLRAIEDGHVERTTNGSLGGLSIYLIGDSGSRYYFAHLDEVGEFEEGQRVYAGQTVGTVGDSGNARGAPHLHMQWAPTGDSNWENPFPLVDVLFGEGVAAQARERIEQASNSRDLDNEEFLDIASDDT